MLKRIRNSYKLARLGWRFLTREEMRSSLQVPFIKRISFLRKGYLSQVNEIYNLKDYQLEDYFSDWSKARMSMMYDNRNIRAGYQYGVNNKIFSTALLGQYLRVPEIYAIVEQGKIVPLSPKAVKIFSGSWRNACRSVGGTMVVKPSAGGRGTDVFLIAERNDKLMIDNSEVTEDDIFSKISSLDEFIIVEFFVQGDYAAKLYPESTNTIRMITIIDPDSNEPYLPIAVQRIGRNMSRPVDNWNRGGICAEVNLATGLLSRAAARETSQRKLVWYDRHPDTGFRITDSRVPEWENIKRLILQAAGRMAYYKFLSWDVVVMEKGIGVIEADAVSGIETLQVHRPLLKDNIVRKFFKYHGYL